MTQQLGLERGAVLDVLNSDELHVQYSSTVPGNRVYGTCSTSVVDTCKRIGNGSTQQARLSDADTSEPYQVPIADQKCSQLPGIQTPESYEMK